MFVSDSSKLAVYYTCQRQLWELRYYQAYSYKLAVWYSHRRRRGEVRFYQNYKYFSYQESKVVKWFLHCQAWYPHTIFSWLDMLCPFKFGAPDNGPDGWHLGLPWFVAQQEGHAAKHRKTTD